MMELIDSHFRLLRDVVEEALMNEVHEGRHITLDKLLAQLLMYTLNNDSVDELSSGQFDVEMKQRLVAMADHMGPDWAQALYHAAVFMTKVA